MSFSNSMRRSFFSTSSLGQRAKVLVVGSGRMGEIRTSLLYANPRFELCGVVDINFDDASALAEKYNTKPYNCLNEAIEQCRPSGLDGLVVSTPTLTHDAIITEAAHNSLSVFTEKPVDETTIKIKEIFDVAKDANVSLCCGFQRRFDDTYRAAAQAVHAGQAGNPLVANIFFADHPAPPKEFMLTGGNIFTDLCVHDVDYIRWVLKDEVVSVYATGTSSTGELASAGVHDNATMIMKFQKGAVVTLFMSRSATYGYDQRCEIFGDRGLVSVENEHENMAVLANRDGIHHAKLKHSFPQRFNQAFTSELDCFADTLLKGKAWPITADDCIRVQKVADAAKKSCEIGKEVTVDYDVPDWDRSLEGKGIELCE